MSKGILFIDSCALQGCWMQYSDTHIASYPPSCVGTKNWMNIDLDTVDLKPTIFNSSSNKASMVKKLVWKWQH